MADNNFKGTVEALFHGMDAVISSRTVVGDAIHINDTIILPLVDVSFAVGAGAFNGDKSGEKKEKGAGGLGGRMTPSAVLVIQNGTTRLVNIKNQDTITKLLDMVPDVLDRFTAKGNGKMSEDDLNDILDEAEEEKK
ncbi:GerW family sporulation protein [Faecalicatena contorta]|uniref:GerW family sporulation protein n=1 Tax=Faecalicatena fissicatena TaxID=290055 RepID=A0ABS2E508_9FIRM|nr:MULTISPECIES: GerW family sporulation protein [Clostridia]MBM6684189.1 GerW family sporulation protein [Faecalicatena contorta]MBM6709499.1 GerW family sporulation protein [Faecalicatena contorta]MBM6736694.1 GerW family sporulation protein [Faecalicatena fissicatena]HIX99946.1 GerW family sporulation protein [Candidatus Dorea intestinigallinarum]